MKQYCSNLEIIHQEESFIIVNKPSGLLAVPGRGPDRQDSIANRVKEAFPNCIAQPAVHRLDMDTSGLMLLAFNSQCHRQLSIQFQQQKVSKRYDALLEGNIEEDHGVIELAFRLDTSNRPYQIYDPEHGKLGITRWKKISSEPPFTRVEFAPTTGRTHQLRVHAAHRLGLGAPIVGDPLYGSGSAHGQMKLHASHLAFDHPISNKRLEYYSPAPF